MTDPRKPLTIGERRADGRELEHLAGEFEAVSELLAGDLCAIVEWLAGGAIGPKPHALTCVDDHLNQVRYLCGQIGELTAKNEKGKA